MRCLTSLDQTKPGLDITKEQFNAHVITSENISTVKENYFPCLQKLNKNFLDKPLTFELPARQDMCEIPNMIFWRNLDQLWILIIWELYQHYILHLLCSSAIISQIGKETDFFFCLNSLSMFLGIIEPILEYYFPLWILLVYHHMFFLSTVADDIHISVDSYEILKHPWIICLYVEL